MFNFYFFIQLLFLFVWASWFPGYVFCRLIKIPFKGNLLAALVLPLVFGIPLTSVVYFSFRMLHADTGILFFLWTATVLAAVLIMRDLMKQGIPKFSRPSWKEVAVFLILFAVMMGYSAHFSSRTYYDEKGGWVIGEGHFDDSIWSISVTSELKHHVPPRLPLLSGYRLRYHYIGDLFTELLYRLSGTDRTMLSFNFQFEPPLFIFLMFAVLALSSKQFFKNRWMTYGALALFMFAPLRDSLFVKHHDTLAVIFIYVALFYLLKLYYEEGESNKSYLIGAFFLLGILPLHDAIFGAITNGVVFLYGVFESLKARKLSPLLIASCAGLLVGGFVYISALGIPHHHVSSFVFGKGPLQEAARQFFKPYTKVLKWILYSFPFTHSWGGQVLVQMVMGFFHTLFFFNSLFIPGILNLALLAVPLVIRIIRHPREYDKLWILIAWIGAAGILFPAFVTYKKGPTPAMTMRAVELTQLILVPYVVIMIQYLWTKRAAFGKTIVIIFFLFYVGQEYARKEFYLKPRLYSYIDRDTVQVFEFLRKKTSPDSVILHPYRDNPLYRVGGPPIKPAAFFGGHYFYVSALGERQAVFEGAASSTTYYMGDASPEQVAERVNEVNRFYETNDRNWAGSFLERFRVDYVWVPRQKELHFPTKGLLESILQNETHSLYRVIGKSG